MNFFSRIKELENQYSTVNAQRVLLEKQIEQRTEYKKVVYEVKADELKDELAKIEIQKIQSAARNKALLQNIERALNKDQAGSSKLQMLKDNLDL